MNLREDITNLLNETGIFDQTGFQQYVFRGDPIKSDDKVLGTLNDTEKAIMKFLSESNDELEKIEKELEKGTKTAEEVEARYNLLSNGGQLLMSLLMFSVGKRFKLYGDHNTFAFRTGNKVVSCYSADDYGVVFGSVQPVGDGGG